LKDCNAFTFMVKQILDCVAVKMNALQSFEISGMTQQMTQSYGRGCWEANVLVLYCVFTVRVWVPSPRTTASFVCSLVGYE